MIICKLNAVVRRGRVANHMAVAGQPKYTNSIPIQNTQNKTIPNSKA